MIWIIAAVIAVILAVVFIAVKWHRQPLTLVSPFPEVEVKSLQAGEWTYRYHISGQGPHIVLLHGLGANLFCWRWLVPLLARRYTVIALDLPGFGQTDKHTHHEYGLDDQVERLHEFLRALGVKKSYLVGNSMGGNIALWSALKYPDECLGCVVIAPATSPRLVPPGIRPLLKSSRTLSYVVNRKMMTWAHLRTVSRKDRVDRDRVEETFRTYGRKPEAVRSFLLGTECISDPRLLAGLPELKTKVLLLWGSEDRIVPRFVIDGLESALRAHESHVHIGGGHHLQEDEPEWVFEKIDAFFKT